MKRSGIRGHDATALHIEAIVKTLPFKDPGVFRARSRPLSRIPLALHPGYLLSPTSLASRKKERPRRRGLSFLDGAWIFWTA
jgi:hypothetical protein